MSCSRSSWTLYYHIWYHSFVSCLGTHETSILCNALSLKEYLPSIQLEVVDVLSDCEWRGAPQPSNLSKSIAEAAHYTFLVMPAAAWAWWMPEFLKSTSHSERPCQWKSCTLSICLFLSLLTRVWVFSSSLSYEINLKRRHGSRRFRFITENFVIIVPSILMSFNTLDGFARWPISHTCSALLELPSTYTSPPTFVSEFHAILADDDLYSWRIDAL